MINKTITIEELIEEVPGAISYLMEQKIRCIRCGEPIWGTLEQAASEKGYSDADIDRFVAELNRMMTEK
ncbi:MAG: DUF1858 domain-containing protein [Calditrichaeota bacterium]|nr:DUF1858 domain-containing protein [Calditrichota bacterium]